MNATQRLVVDWLLASGLRGDDLLHEALLRRGFLAVRRGEDVLLATGSHVRDIEALELIGELDVRRTGGCANRQATVSLRSLQDASVAKAVTAIVGLGEHHIGEAPGPWTSIGPGAGIGQSWEHYRRMAWGPKLPVCPTTRLDAARVDGALDSGIALLVKTLPLARVATSHSCDGHGARAATIDVHYPWDVPWAKAVFAVVGAPTPNSRWAWSDELLLIEPLGGYGDAEVLGMFNDIQGCARRLMDQAIVDWVGRARARTLAAFDEAPSVARFASESARQLGADSPPRI